MIDVCSQPRKISTGAWRRQSLGDGRRWRVCLPCSLPVLPLRLVQLGLIITPFMLAAVTSAPHCRRCRLPPPLLPPAWASGILPENLRLFSCSCACRRAAAGRRAVRAAGHFWRGVCAGASSHTKCHVGVHTPLASTCAMFVCASPTSLCQLTAGSLLLQTQVLDAATWCMTIPEPEAQVGMQSAAVRAASTFAWRLVEAACPRADTHMHTVQRGRLA